MALTRDFKETVAARVQNDPAFAQALLDEAITLFVNGEPESAKLILRDLVNATLGFEALGWVTLRSIHQLQNVDFIFQVGPFSFVVALLAGAAGMLSLVTSKSAALVGVFISVTTVPAAGMSVVAATTRDWDVALASAGQLAVNMVGIVAAGVLVLAGYNRARRR